MLDEFMNNQKLVSWTYSYGTNETERSAAPIKTHTKSPDIQLRKPYKLISSSSKKDQNSTYNRIKRLHLPLELITPDKKSARLRYCNMTPDYADVKSKIDSFREASHPIKLNVNLQDKVRNELLLNKEQAILRTMNSALRTDEQFINKDKPQSDKAFIRLHQRLNPVNSRQPQSIKPKINHQIYRVYEKKSEALFKTLNISKSQWLKKRGFPHGQYSKIAKQVFEILDQSKTGKVPSEQFIIFLIEIGVPLEENVLKKVISWMVKEKHLQEPVITEETLEQIFRGDKKTDLFLLAFQDVLGESFKTLDALEQVKKWWTEFGSRFVSINLISEFLVKIRIFGSFAESKKYLIKLFENESLLSHLHFLSLFGKSIIKHALTHIEKKFTEEDWKNPDLSLAFKFSQLKKRLVLAGIKYPIDKISHEEGAQTLKAIQNLKKAANQEKFDLEEFKKKWHKLTGFLLEQSPVKRIQRDEEKKYNLSVFYAKDFEGSDCGFKAAQQESEKEELGLKPRLYPTWDLRYKKKLFSGAKVKLINNKTEEKDSGDF